MNSKLIASIYVDRGGFRTLCDLCKAERGTEIHHIVSKGRTQGSPEARDLSECKELLSLLCRECHAKAHNPDVATALLRFNAVLYGEDEVRAALEAVNSRLSRPINIKF